MGKFKSKNRNFVSSYLFKQVTINGKSGHIMYKVGSSGFKIFPRMQIKGDKTNRAHWIDVSIQEYRYLLKTAITFLEKEMDFTKRADTIEFIVKSRNKSWFYVIGHDGEQCFITIKINNGKGIRFTFIPKSVVTSKMTKQEVMLNVSKNYLLEYLNTSYEAIIEATMDLDVVEVK